MPKNPAAHNAPGHRGGQGTVYATGDSRLVGMGNPPSDPEWQAANPGAGRMVMPTELVDVEQIDAERRPPEDKWILKPAGQRVGVKINLDDPDPEPA